MKAKTPSFACSDKALTWPIACMKPCHLAPSWLCALIPKAISMASITSRITPPASGALSRIRKTI